MSSAPAASPEQLPARMINEFSYCPRLFYLEYVQQEWDHSADTLEGKAAEATFWTLRIMQGLLGSTDPTDMAALRDALGERLSGDRRRDAA